MSVKAEYSEMFGKKKKKEKNYVVFTRPGADFVAPGKKNVGLPLIE
jgi:hypothetical protein